jgi:hypothetical protein
MLGICHGIQITSLQKQGQFVEKEYFISTNMVHNGAPNVGAHFNGYFYNCKYIIKFERSLMSFIVGIVSSTLWSLCHL